MIEEKTIVDFMIIEIQIFSFGGFYINKICMMRKLPVFTFWENMGATMLCLRKK